MKKYALGLLSALAAVSIIVNFTGGVSVTCGGVNDTSALQSAITSAEFTGDEVLLPSMPCKFTAPLVVNERISVRGVGYQYDGGKGYGGLSQVPAQWLTFNPIPSPLYGSILLPGAHDAFQITTNRAVKLSGFQISYDQSAASGSSLAAIRLSAAAGAHNFNAGSVFRDLTITNADIGIELTNAMEFRVDNVNVVYSWERGIVISSPNGPSWGDSYIEGSTLWGQNIPGHQCHICYYSGGGLRIINNKLNVGNGASGSGIFINPNLSPQQETTEPLIITGNSIEGQAVGINIANGNVAGASITEIVIGNNQIWSGINAIRVNPNGTSKWFSGFTITGNALMVNGGMNKTVMVLDNAQIGVVAGNQFVLSGGGSGWGTNIGTNTSSINVQSNVYAPGIVPAVNAGTGNTIGGGSP